MNNGINKAKQRTQDKEQNPQTENMDQLLHRTG